MREIKVQEITAAVSKLCKDSCYYLPEELLEKLKASIATEESPLGQEILTTIVENAELAKAKDVPICQDIRFDSCLYGNRTGSTFCRRRSL